MSVVEQPASDSDRRVFGRVGVVRDQDAMGVLIRASASAWLAVQPLSIPQVAGVGWFVVG